MTDERIGFIGLGFMGHGMAKNIVEKGYPLTVMGHRKREAVDDLVRRGAKEARTPREVAEASTIVFLCVTGSPQVEAAGARPRRAARPAPSPAPSSSTPRRRTRSPPLALAES